MPSISSILNQKKIKQNASVLAGFASVIAGLFHNLHRNSTLLVKGWQANPDGIVAVDSVLTINDGQPQGVSPHFYFRRLFSLFLSQSGRCRVVVPNKDIRK